MSTTWWAASIGSEKDWADFDEAVADVHWVIDQAVGSLRALPEPASPVPSEIPQKPPSSSGISWMARADGKRQLKPTARLLEGGGI